jgi:hypothetical protein
MPDAAPRWNFYRCRECAHVWVTVDVTPGVTPAFLACRRDGCSGQMASAGYPKPENWPDSISRTPDAEWYTPGEYERRKMRKKYPALYSHVLKGGLILRPAGPTTPAFPVTTTGGGYGS